MNDARGAGPDAEITAPLGDLCGVVEPKLGVVLVGQVGFVGSERDCIGAEGGEGDGGAAAEGEALFVGLEAEQAVGEGLRQAVSDGEVVGGKKDAGAKGGIGRVVEIEIGVEDRAAIETAGVAPGEGLGDLVGAVSKRGGSDDAGGRPVGYPGCKKKSWA
ncbi:MAG: hypothetical protein R3C14_40490 [Caldilineaceae bacterium]